jgi:outer membrane protein insertion porin family/translocation and assembly module TamA
LTRFKPTSPVLAPRLYHLLSLTLLFLIVFATPSVAIVVDDLDPRRSWRLEDLRISGTRNFSAAEVLEEVQTKTRPWYLFWRARPPFDPVIFREDLERLRRFYESRGYYEAEIAHDLDIDEENSSLSVVISVSEGAPVIVSEIDLEVVGPRLFPKELPIKSGEVFVEQKYQKGEETLRQFYLRRSHAHVQTERRAEVNLDSDEAHIWYRADPGPRAVFGDIEIQGMEDVDPQIVRRELTFRAGERFAPEKILESQEKLLALNLFSMVRIAPKQVSGRPAVVPMEIDVREKEAREIRAAIGYGTEDEFRGQLQWRHNNWLGGGRRFSLTARYSALAATGVAEIVQPHLLSPRNRAVLTLRHDREDEETFLLNATRFIPRVERAFSRRLTAFVGYRLEYAQVNSVSDQTVQSLGGLKERGLLSGPLLGVRWSSTDDLLNPTRGEVATFTINQAGKIWGGAYSFYKLVAEARKYISIGWETVFASRLKIGLADTLGADKDFPIFERFFSGGEQSVRGYGRRRLGPFSGSGDPLGGLSLIEGSVEVRRPLWGDIGGALFLDFGQVSTQSFDVPIDALKFAAGFGLTYRTPVGPLRLDVGFPFDPPRGDRPWQVHFSVGASF